MYNIVKNIKIDSYSYRRNVKDTCEFHFTLLFTGESKRDFTVYKKQN